MPKLQRGPLVAALLSLALVAAACGDSDTETLDTAAGDATATQEDDTSPAEASDSDQTPSQTEESQDLEPGSSESDGDASSDGDAATDGDSASEAEPTPHQFPDLSTVNIVDGSTINLADQLVGGDTPVLLWFFAPH